MEPSLTDLGHRAHNRILQYQFSLSSVGVGAIGAEEELEVVPAVSVIRAVNCSCASTDFDLSIRRRAGAAVDTNDEIFKAEGCNKQCDRTDLVIHYANADTVRKDSLYALITNNDGARATGSVTLELTIETLECVGTPRP